MSHFPVSCRAWGGWRADRLQRKSIPHRKFTSGDGKWAMLLTYMASQSTSKNNQEFVRFVAAMRQKFSAAEAG